MDSSVKAENVYRMAMPFTLAEYRSRVAKVKEEMAYTRTAARIADIGMKAAVEHIKPGMTELDLRAEVDYACAKAGGETPGLPTLVRGGKPTTRWRACRNLQTSDYARDGCRRLMRCLPSLSC